MRGLLLFLCALALLAQNPTTAKFPGAIATDQDLLAAKDQSASTLSAGIDASTLSVPVADGSKFTGYEVVTIESEQLLVCSVAANTLTICPGGRGFAGTTAASHNSGAAVRGHITAWHHNQLAAEVMAVQNQLGANMGNVAPASHQHSHTSLSDIGTNTHAQIDTHLGASSGVHGITGSVVGTSDVQVLTNKVLTDANVTFQDDGDNTKRANFNLSNISPSATRTYHLPNGSTTLVGTDLTQPLSNKTLYTPIITAYTVATLPSPGTANRVAIVTDAAAAGSCTSGGGSYRAWCRDTGSAWEALGDGGGGVSTTTRRYYFPAAGCGYDSGGTNRAVHLWAGGNHTGVKAVCRHTSGSSLGYVYLNDTSNPTITFRYHIPSSWTGASVTMKLIWMGEADGGGNSVLLNFQVTCAGDGDDPSDGGTTQDTGDQTLSIPATAYRFSSTTITLPKPAGCVAGSNMRVRLIRNTTDTYTNNLGIIGAELAVPENL